MGNGRKRGGINNLSVVMLREEKLNVLQKAKLDTSRKKGKEKHWLESEGMQTVLR